MPKDVLKLDKNTEQATPDKIKEYQSLVAKLLYPTTICRPDAAWHVAYMARFASNPTIEQMSYLKRLLRYFKGTRTLGITYSADATSPDKDLSKVHSIGLCGYTDASFGDTMEKRSSAGYLFMIAGGVISFKSFKQRIVTASTTEAEFITQTYGAKEAVWIHTLLAELGYDGNDRLPTQLYSDCLPAVQLAHSHGHHERTKHIDIHYKWIRQAIELGKVKLAHVAGTEMAADGLTKPLEHQAHQHFVNLIKMTPIDIT